MGFNLKQLRFGRWAALLTVCLAARAVAGTSEGAGDFVAEVWDTDSGLPQNTVTSLAQTPDGYLWIGTLHGGLARFDGSHFINFHPANTPALKSIEIHRLLVDAAGTLWIGNVEGGLISCRDGKFRFEYWNNDTRHSWVDDIMLDRPGKMDFSSQNGLVFRHLVLSPTNDSWQAINLPDAHPVAMACEDAAAGILYRRLDGQPAWFDEARTAKIAWSPGMARSPVNAIKKDWLGRIWVGANNGLFLWNGTDLVRQPPTNDGDESVQSLLPGPDGGVWLGSAHHLRRFADGGWSCSLLLSATNAAAGDLADFAPQFANSHGGVWLWHPLKKLLYVSADGKISRPGLAGQQLSGAPLCWLEDQEGNVWLGLNEGGLVRLRPRIFHPLWPDPFGDSPVACSVCEDARGVVWFGGGGRQVWRWEHDAFTSFQPPSGPSFEETKVTPADGGDLWVGTVKNGLLRLHEGKYSRPFAALQIGTVARCLLPDRRGGLWIGSEFGLFHWDDNNGLKAFNPSFARPQANP